MFPKMDVGTVRSTLIQSREKIKESTTIPLLDNPSQIL